MNYVFWFTENSNIYWHGIIIAIAIIAAILAAAGLRRVQNKSDAPVYTAAAIAIPVAYLLSRISYWFFNKEFFKSLGNALISPSIGGNSLFGAAFGVVIALFIVKAIYKIDDFAAFIDAIAPAAMLGICIGRLSGYFSLDDRGKIIENSATQKFPFAIFDTKDNVWHLSVFVLESIAAGLIFVLSLIMFLYVYRRNKSNIGSGNVVLVSLLLFGATQGPLEGMRLDSLFMNSLGFVRIMQITSLILILFVLVFYSVTSIKKNKFRLIHIIAWIVSAGLLTLAFFMEFRIHSAVFSRNYAIMVTCLLLVSYIAMRLFALTYSTPSKDSGLMRPLRKRR